MTVYIDQYIIINTILNFVILRFTKYIIKSTSSNMKLVVSSFIGGIFALFMVFPEIKFMTGFITKIIFSVILTLISFKSVNLKDFLKNLTVFYFVSFTIGGCGYAIMNFIKSGNFSSTTKLLSITVLLSYIILNVISSIYEKHLKYDRLTHKLTIVSENKHIETKCFYDTGNSLRDPISKLPVIIVNISIIKDLLPEKFTDELIQNKDVVEIYFEFSKEIKLKLIPYHTVSNNGFMLGFIPTKILIDDKPVNAVIGISVNILSTDNTYNAIVNPQTI